ncbi:MAG: hypothetical protein GXO63_01120 [Candidatus Micrarchaeota archaeon]|nr:hypothetical protein [Candidatus Micrarchaeota archaeon]
MRGQSQVLQAVLIFSVVVSLAITAAPMAYDAIQGSMDAAEIEKIRNEFLKCSDKILETARIGSGNKCIFSVSRGMLEAKKDGIYYTITSKQKVCSEHAWKTVQGKPEIWESCSVNGGYTYSLRFLYPKSDAVLFSGNIVVETPYGSDTYTISQKGTLTVEFIPKEGLSGRTVELIRYRTEENKTVVKINVY